MIIDWKCKEQPARAVLWFFRNAIYLLTLTLMVLGLDSSALGMRSVSTPFSTFASALAEFSVEGDGAMEFPTRAFLVNVVRILFSTEIQVTAEGYRFIDDLNGEVFGFETGHQRGDDEIIRFGAHIDGDNDFPFG